MYGQDLYFVVVVGIIAFILLLITMVLEADNYRIARRIFGR